SDDAGVYLLHGDQVLIQTVDFFTPIVDDPFDYGQIAAANSLSDVYAMGGTPITALNIVGYPMKEAPSEWLYEILRGGAEKALEAGVAILGGHTVEDPEIKYGLSVTGIGHRDQITANRGARVGDRLVLTKALGTGLVTSAIKRGVADEAATRAVTDSMKTLNRAASAPGRLTRRVGGGRRSRPRRHRRDRRRDGGLHLGDGVRTASTSRHRICSQGTYG